MPPSAPHTDPEHPRSDDAPSSDNAPPAPGSGTPAPPDAPVTFVPHDPSGAVSSQPVKISTRRHGELESHELLHLLNTMEDERARSRFRESIYISVFFYVALAWFLFYGPRVLWHAPRLKLPSEVIREHELTALNSPILLSHPLPAPRPTPPPRVDNRTLERLREAEPAPPPPAPAPARAAATPQPPAPSSLPLAPSATPNLPVPNAPQPQPAPSRTPPPVVAEAPAPQPGTRPSFNPGSNSLRDLARGAAHSSGTYPSGSIIAPIRGGGSVGSGSEILSDTQGVDFSAWKRRFDRGTIDAWIPLLPEEIQPPLMKKGETVILLTILPDGSIGDIKLEGSTHDEALNRAAWGSLTSQGKLPPLPSAFHGPNLILRLHYLVNMNR